MAGVNEVLAILLMAAKFGVPVCPHAGGVGLCEYVQHLAIFDYIAVGASLENRVCEYVDHLHEHFVEPVRIRSARYLAPTAARLQHHDEARVPRPLRVPAAATRGGAEVGTSPLGRLRPALLRDDHQLRRPAGPRDPGSGPAALHRLERGRVRLHRHGLPGRLRPRPAGRRSHPGPRRDEARLRRGHRGLEPRRHGPCLRPIGVRLRRRALRPGPRRIGQLPGLDQDRGGVVPPQGARLRHRPLQRRDQPRRHRGARGGADHHPGLRLALGLRPDGRHRIRLAARLARPVRHSRGPPASHAPGARPHPVRPRGAVHPIPWLTLLGRRQAWAVALGKFLTDPIWWFYLFWLPEVPERAPRPWAREDGTRPS